MLEVNQIIEHQGKRFQIERLILNINSCKRTEYQALELLDDDLQGTHVRLIAYESSSRALAKIEEETLRKVQGPAFERFIDSFETTLSDASQLAIIVTDFHTGTETLRQRLEGREMPAEVAWKVFWQLVMALQEITVKDEGNYIMSITPNCLWIDENDDLTMRCMLFGLHVNENGRGLEINSTECDFRAPETYLHGTTWPSLQFSLALLLIYMLQGEHPWGLLPSAGSYQAYSRMQIHEPKIDITGDLGNVLRRALSIETNKRYVSVDEFLREVAAASNDELPQGFEGFAIPENRPKPQERSRNISMGMNPADLEDKLRDEISTKDPTIKVNLQVPQGEGFKAVAGMEGLKAQLQRDFIDVVHHRELASQYGIIPPGMLFFGPPGTGKTYIAQRLAEELGIEYSIIYPSDLGNIYVHGSQMLIRQLFDKARLTADRNGKGVLLVFDEIDSVAPLRTADDHSHQGGEVAELLTQLNEASSHGVYVIGTTNCINRLDKAVYRKGRLDKVVYVGLPDAEARGKLFDYELGKRPHAEGINLEWLSSLTEGYTSSDIAYVVAECSRRKFAASLLMEPKQALCIDQQVLEEVISDTRSSVTRADAKKYEEMRDEYAQGVKQRPRLGFF